MTLAQSSCLGKFGGNGDGCGGGGWGWGEGRGVVVTDGDDGDGGKGGGLRGGEGGDDECFHHPLLSNSPSSELSSIDVTQPNCGALKQRVTFTVIVARQRWRLFRVDSPRGSDGGRCPLARAHAHAHT